MSEIKDINQLAWDVISKGYKESAKNAEKYAPIISMTYGLLKTFQVSSKVEESGVKTFERFLINFPITSKFCYLVEELLNEIKDIKMNYKQLLMLKDYWKIMSSSLTINSYDHILDFSFKSEDNDYYLQNLKNYIIQNTLTIIKESYNAEKIIQKFNKEYTKIILSAK